MAYMGLYDSDLVRKARNDVFFRPEIRALSRAGEGIEAKQNASRMQFAFTLLILSASVFYIDIFHVYECAQLRRTLPRVFLFANLYITDFCSPGQRIPVPSRDPFSIFLVLLLSETSCGFRAVPAADSALVFFWRTNLPPRGYLFFRPFPRAKLDVAGLPCRDLHLLSAARIYTYFFL